MIHSLFLFSLNLITCQNLALRINRIQGLNAAKSEHMVEPFLEDKKIFSEILIDLGDNNPLFESDILLSTIKTTLLPKYANNFTKSLNYNNTSFNSQVLKNSSVNLTQFVNVSSRTQTSILRSLKNRDIRFFFKNKNESNKLIRNKNENSFFTIYNVIENKTSFMVIKINKELLILIASLSSIFLIAFTVITFLYKCINFPYNNQNVNKNHYSPCRYH